MLLRRLAEALKSQNWLVVTIELVVVILGIFIGLQVNNWNIDRQNLNVEMAYLERLERDITADIERFETVEAIFAKKAQNIAVLMEADASTIADLAATLSARELEQLSWVSLPQIRSATYDELKSSGRLVLLRDPALRNALSDYYGWYDFISEVLFRSFGEYRKFLFASLGGDIYYQLLLEGAPADTEAVAAALISMQAMPGYGAAANQEIAYCATIVSYLRLFRSQAHEVLEIIDKAPAG